MSSDKNLKAADAFDYGGKTYDQDCAAGYAGKDAELAEGNAVAEDADQPCCQKPCAAGAEGDACPFAQHDIDAVSVYSDKGKQPQHTHQGAGIGYGYQEPVQEFLSVFCRTDGLGAQNFRISYFVPADYQIYTCDTDDKAASQQHPVLMRLYESADE